MQNFVGKQIDRYRIIAQQGVGGMAVVYKAYDPRLERDVAIKVIRTEAIPPEQYERLMKRFDREAKAQAQFSHPNIVPVYDYGEVNGSPYLVMEYIEGGTLKDKLQKPAPCVQAVSWILPIADALSYAHQLGVVHRDVKPSNILFDKHSGRPILTDFGIAKVLETTEATLTGTGLGVGTPEYMAPEQWQGKASEASDQYALGVVFYELVTGQKPFTAETPVAVALKQMSEPLIKPSSLVEGVPEALEKVLYKALARMPEDRYETMHAFYQALTHLVQGFDTGEIKQISTAAKQDVREGSQPSSIPVDSEGETYDILEPSPPRKAAAEKQKIPAGKSKRLPMWALWGGVGLTVVCVFAVGLSLILFGKDLFNLDSKAETSEGAVITTVAPTDTEKVAEQMTTPAAQNTLKSTVTKESTSAPTHTQWPTNTSSVYITPTPSEYHPIPGCASSHLHVGDSAFVSYEGGKNHVRTEPDTAPSDNVLFDIYPGEVVEVIGGPECNFGWIMWEIETTYQESGWTPESDGDEFWMYPIATRSICKDAFPTRLVVGKKAKVNEEPPDSNLLREGPGRNYTVIDKIRPGRWMMVLEGPECGEAVNWWKVESLDTGTVGWTMEANLDYYYLSPEP